VRVLPKLVDKQRIFYRYCLDEFAAAV